jgi:hypothetical protein
MGSKCAKKAGNFPHVRSFSSAFFAQGTAARGEVKPPIMMALVSKSRLDRRLLIFLWDFSIGTATFCLVGG